MITLDEESSGIIEVREGEFLFDAQVHKATTDPETVELGQLLKMTVDFDAVYGENDEDDEDELTSEPVRG